jgi:L-ribulose-5-phosphate 4-epimerase
MDEGYIKFHAEWIKGPALPKEDLQELIYWRQFLFQRRLIGMYPNGIGYGNISQRWKPPVEFVISGSGTGGAAQIEARHFASVLKVDPDNNRLICEGPAVASSESMSHAAIYRSDAAVQAAVHVHHRHLWERLLHRVPTTGSGIPYGTPEMAYSIRALFEQSNVKQDRIFVMEGHPEGIFTFGQSLEEAVEVLMKKLRKLEN